MREIETKLLRGFFDSAESPDLRRRKLKADVSNIDAVTEQRVDRLEYRIRLIEHRLDFGDNHHGAMPLHHFAPAIIRDNTVTGREHSPSAEKSLQHLDPVIFNAESHQIGALAGPQTPLPGNHAADASWIDRRQW